MHHSHSRRKQNRPNRATVTSSTSSPSAATAFPRNLSEDDFEVSSSTPQLFDSSPLPSGTTLGPFPVRPATLEDSPKFIFKVHDFAQQTFAFTLLGPEAQLLKRISAAPTPSEANAAVTPVSADGRQLGLQVLVTKPAALSDLRAIYIEKPSVPKKFPCGLCNKALFSTMENLKNHQQSYCQPAQPTVIASSQFPSLLTHFMRPPNLPILLPVAFHNHENPALVQLIGNPQIFLPVAVHPRPVQFSSTPLVLDRDMCQNLQVPQSLTLGNNEALNLEIVVAGTNGVIATEEKPAPEAEIVEPNPKRPKQEEPSAESDPLPLDLSRKSSRPNSSAANSVASQNKAPSPMKIRAPVAVKSKPVDSKAAAASTEKPFVCDCGVAFTNKEILLGHRKFYCKNGPGANEPPREPLRKSVSYTCPRQACTFEGSSNTQLQTHIRQIHNNIRGYMCKFCGYRGQSLRGMRSHLKDHEHLSSESQNENEFILEITKETNTFVCPQCKLEIPTIFQLKHKCPERERTDS